MRRAAVWVAREAIFYSAALEAELSIGERSDREDMASVQRWELVVDGAPYEEEAAEEPEDEPALVPGEGHWLVHGHAVCAMSVEEGGDITLCCGVCGASLTKQVKRRSLAEECRGPEWPGLKMARGFLAKGKHPSTGKKLLRRW